MNTFFAIALLLLLGTVFGLALTLRASRRAKSALQQKFSVVESDLAALTERLETVEKLQEEELSQDQIEYRDKIQAQYAVLFQQVQDAFKTEIKTVQFRDQHHCKEQQLSCE